MNVEDHELAVLFAIDSATKRVKHVSAPDIFSHLTKALRERWSERYLTDGILRELIRGEFVLAMQVAPGKVHYHLTRKGRDELRQPTLPTAA